MILHELIVDERLPSASCYQFIHLLVIAHSEVAIRLQVFLTHCENSKAARSQSTQHVVKALCGKQIGAESSSACDYIKGSSERSGKSLFADDVRLYIFVDALALQARLLGLTAALRVKFCQALLCQKFS